MRMSMSLNDINSYCQRYIAKMIESLGTDSVSLSITPFYACHDSIDAAAFIEARSGDRIIEREKVLLSGFDVANMNEPNVEAVISYVEVKIVSSLAKIQSRLGIQSESQEAPQ